MAFTRAAQVFVVAGLLVGGVPESGWAQPQPAVDPYYEFLLARHLEGENDNAGALAALQRAAAAEPRSAEIRAEIASFHMRRNQRAEAEKAAREAVALDANNVEANRVLGLILSSYVETERNPTQQLAYAREAITYLEKVTSATVGVQDLNVNFTLGGLYLSTEQTDKAIQAMTRVLAQNPEAVQARLRMAEAQAQGKDLPGAISTLEEIVEDEPRVAARLGQFQQQAGLLREAVESFTLALTANPNSRPIKATRILLLYDLKDYPRAAQAAAEAQRQHPDDPQFPRLQASALYAGGDTTKAIDVLEGAARQFPRDTTTPLALADMYQRVKRFPDAERVLRQRIASDPNDTAALNSLGYMFANNNDRLDEAIRLLNQALQLKPGQAEYLDSLGWAHFKKGNLDDAERFLNEAVAKMPANAEVLEHVGDLHAKRSRWPQAIQFWTQALAGEGGGVDRGEIEKKIADAKGKLR
jgi:tetratricopeptide (TPR) repeat protein